MPRWLSLEVLLLLVLTHAPFAWLQSARPGTLPAALEKYVTNVVHLTASDRELLMGGEPVTKLLDANAGHEVAVFGAVWIDAPSAAYVRQVKDIENFERGGAFRMTKLISDPPALADFDALELPDEDVADLRSCRVGNCELKLGAQALKALQSDVDWNEPDAKRQADALFRQFAFEYVQGYRQGGNARLAVYRDADRPTFVAREFASMIERLPSLSEAPDLKRYLLEYPSVALPASTDFLYWQETQFGLKPTIRINHIVIQDRGDSTVIASKMLYATHYFWTALELRVLMPDPARGNGFWFVMVNRSRSDGLSGFLGRFIRGRVRDEALKGTGVALAATKTNLESPRR